MTQTVFVPVSQQAVDVATGTNMALNQFRKDIRKDQQKAALAAGFISLLCMGGMALIIKIEDDKRAKRIKAELDAAAESAGSGTVTH